MSISRFVALVVALLFVSGAQASPNSDVLGRCLSDNTTGKDRKDLARWIFVGMSAHPEIGVVARASHKDVEAAQRTMGTLFTRLVADQCSQQMNAVVQSDGTEGIKVAFEYLGRMAMQELMSNQEVNAAMGGFERYIDKVKVDRVVKSK